MCAVRVIGLDAARTSGSPVVFEGPARKCAGNVRRGERAGAWNGNVRGPSGAFSQRPKRRGAGSAAARDQRIPGWSKVTSAPARNRRRFLEPQVTVPCFDGELVDVRHLDAVGALRHGTIAKRYELTYDKVLRHLADQDVGGGSGSKGNAGMETIAATETGA